MRLLIVSIFAATLGVSCIGDLSHPVTYENATDARVTIYPRGRSYPGVKRVLESGATQKDNLLVGDMNPQTFVARVEAVNDSDVVVFCRAYTNGELDQLQGRIVVRSGDLGC